mgnify:CR=1 FL=1
MASKMRIFNSIYADYQASTPVNSTVLEKMLPYYQEDFANPHSSAHSLGWRSAAAIDQATSSVAQMIGADQDEITFTSGATEANNLAILGLGRHNLNGKRKKILISSIEHKCSLEAVNALRDKSNYVIEEIPVDNDGFVDLDYLEKSMSDDVLLVSVGIVNGEIGTIQPLGEVSGMAQRHGVLLHCDAAQGPAAHAVNDIVEFADLVSLSAHKFYGPKGVGALYVRRGLNSQIEPLIFGGGQQNGLRSGTLPTPLVVGMGVASDIAAQSKTLIQIEELRQTRNRFIGLLKKKIESVSVNGPSLQSRHPGNANICFHDRDARQLLAMMQPRVAASMGSACSSGIIEPSYVLRAIGLGKDEANSSIRFSFGYGTTTEDVDDIVDIIAETLAQLPESFLHKIA